MNAKSKNKTKAETSIKKVGENINGAAITALAAPDAIIKPRTTTMASDMTATRTAITEPTNAKEISRQWDGQEQLQAKPRRY